VKVLGEKQNTFNPRQIAILILNRYFRTGRPLKEIINSYFENHDFSGLDRRFIFNIVKGTVRYYLKIDFIISLFSDKKVKNIHPAILNILRMGIYQLVYMGRVPDYSAVNESVNLAKKNTGLSSTGFVNAVLRRISSIQDMESFVKVKIKSLSNNEIDKISIDFSYPSWLVRYWVDWYGREKTVQICSLLNENPRTYLRFNKSKIRREELINELSIKSVSEEQPGHNVKAKDESISEYIRLEKGNHEQLISASKILEDTLEVSSVQDISKTDIYRRGLVSVQDLSSQIAVRYFVNPLRGEKILDVCAAPGGKTAYIAELVGGDGEVLSVDISRARLKIMEDNLKRLNIKNVSIVEADATEPGFLDTNRDTKKNKSLRDNKKINDGYEGYFDRILVDAPCSAFGTISKNPDAKYNRTIDDIVRFSEISLKMMINCDIYLKSGGKLIFYTCTLSPIENQQVIEKFLKVFKGKYIIEKPDIQDRLRLILNSKENMPEISEENYLEIMPYYFGSEAGFICSILKK